MNIALPPDLERRMAEKIEQGFYHTVGEMVRDGLRLLFEADDLRERLLEGMRADIKLGLDQLDRGEMVSGEAAFAEITRRIDSRDNA